MGKPIKAILLGAGERGANAYGVYALNHPEDIQFIAVAEPNTTKREKFAESHAIDYENRYESWQDVLGLKKFADVVVNCTQDRMHYGSGMAALKQGYAMLIEKPICHTLEKTIELVSFAEKSDLLLMVCHVLRYTEFFNKVHEILRSGALGQIITISHRENVSSWHMAHSYVRGNWRKESEATPMILAKCCHDFDFLFWILEESVEVLSSFGTLRHFKSENAPEGAPRYCMEGCPVAEDCPFFAARIYVDLQPFKESISRSKNPLLRLVGKLSLKHLKVLRTLGRIYPRIKSLTEYSGWPRSVITDDAKSDEAVSKALREGSFGRCVYACDNDVVDNQIVLMQHPSGISSTLTMHGHSHEEGRTLRIDGSHATLLGKFSMVDSYVEIWDHRGFLAARYDFASEIESGSGHGGGDFGLMQAFVDAYKSKETGLPNPKSALESHVLAFAAEEARIQQKVINIREFKKRYHIS